MYRSLGGEIITTGSDAHKACHIAYSYEIITDMLKNTGFNYYTIFKERKPESYLYKHIRVIITSFSVD